MLLSRGGGGGWLGGDGAAGGSGGIRLPVPSATRPMTGGLVVALGWTQYRCSSIAPADRSSLLV